MKFKVGDKVRAIVSDPRVANTIVTITDAEKVMDIQYYIAKDTNGEAWGFSEDELEPVYADSRTIKEVIDDYRNQLLNLYRTSVGKRADNIYFDEWTFKEEKKMPTKFTFYTTEGYRMDKSNNTKIPTMTTEVLYKDKDGCAKGGSATCDKADYNERQGCLEALANAMLGGNFDRDFNRAVKANELADKKKRTCTYCGKVFDTVEEKQAEEAWHVERKKARRERYLLRKRAKEIAFEEQAQKLAKEIIAEDNKK